MGPIGPWATGRPTWSPTADVTGVRPIVDRYSITKYSPMEWRRTNQTVLDIAFNTDMLKHNTKCTIDSIAAATDKQQTENSLRLQHRVQDIRRNQNEIEALVKDLREEIVLLTEAKVRLKFALPILKMPESIAGECIERRTSRIDPDLVRDEVEEELIKELAMIHEVRILYEKIIGEIENQMLANRACKDQLEMNWSDKKETVELESVNARLRNDSPTISFHQGATRIQAAQSSPETWEHYNRTLIETALDEVRKSRDFRKMVDSTLLGDAIRDLRNQADKVLICLRRRIEETDQCRQTFERELKTVLQQIGEAESLYDGLHKLNRQLEFGLKVAQTRLDNRMYRPREENCRDVPQYGLIDEVRNINENLAAVRRQIEEIDATLSKLYKARSNLEFQILTKRKSLYIDQQRCLAYREKYPDAVALGGGQA